MRFLIVFILFFSVSFYSSAQRRWKYKIKVVEHAGKRQRGFFYAAKDDQLILVRKNGDTIQIGADKIERLYIHKRGIVAPFAIAGAAIFFIFAAQTPYALEGAVLLFVGVPIGVSLGLVTGELFANKRFYKRLEAKDIPLIKLELQKYTELK